ALRRARAPARAPCRGRHRQRRALSAARPSPALFRRPPCRRVLAGHRAPRTHGADAAMLPRADRRRGGEGDRRMQQLLSVPALSVVVPVYGNAQSIPQLLDALRGLARRVEGGFEAVFVVDGSPDDSHALLRAALPTA